MSRIAKSKAKSKNIPLKSCEAAKHTRKTKNGTSQLCFKKEFVVDTSKGTSIEEVFHRKSERRRVARDIFLVFEEDSDAGVKTRSNKKQTKAKCGHLKVEDPVKAKGLLRDIKNEPKCYISSSTSSVNATLPAKVLIKNKKSNNANSVKKEINGKAEKNSFLCKAVNTVSKNIKSLKISTLNARSCTFDSERKVVARVNPIFLWVKQDNTRIVEVRCEDYDKRNRIRITKTPNGWRAIPLSDATTSRVLKFYPTPLLKVKRESIPEANTSTNKTANKEIVACKDFSIPNIFPGCVANEISTRLNGINTVCNPIAIRNIKIKTTKFKKKTHSKQEVNISKPSTISTIQMIANNETVQEELNPPHNKYSPEILDFPLQINASLESIINNEKESENNIYTKDLNEKIPLHNFKSNTDDLEIYTNSLNLSLTIANSSETKYTYQKENEEFVRLCPKTGLFLPNHISIAEYENESNEKIDEQNTLRTDKKGFLMSSKEFNSETAKICIESKQHIDEENAESLESNTKNLKDLLDDADLLQNCDDNANRNAELIDTLVKTSCENNLIQANEIITKTCTYQINQKALQKANEIGVQIISDVSDAPKCLSFNEAGEIEGLNGELFHSNSCLETFDKQQSTIISTEPQIMLRSTTSVVETKDTSQKSSSCKNIEHIVNDTDINNSNLRPLKQIEDSPKDLSYKKREEVCPPESCSQCAVTSSSDVVKSPVQGETSISTSSETLKNLILDQFIKLNALTTQNQRETIDLENQRRSGISNMESIYTSKSAQSSFIGTVVINDDENDSYIEHGEPLKKRLRANHKVLITQNVGKLAMINEDPDPLTQLRLLIRNTQWKVPDPILVPKDRLSAVLASPAREIPLLITTRPELRLPEAFAYPEIIQNPNILVISMAQLEAILKNEIEVEKSPNAKAMKPEDNHYLSENQIDIQLNRINDLKLQSPGKHPQHTAKEGTNVLTSVNNSQAANKSIDYTDIKGSLSGTRHEYVNKLQEDSSLSHINSTTMSVLNQMIWLPYIGQLSQNIEKLTKNPTTLQEKFSNVVPFFNTQLNGITNLEDNLKNIAKVGKSVSNAAFQSFQQQLTPSEELSLFQKIAQHQMQRVFQLNQLKLDSPQVMDSVAAENTVFSIDKSKDKIESLSSFTEQRKQRVLSNNKQTNTAVCKNQINNFRNNILVPEKSYNLRSSVAGRHSVESKQYSNYNQRQVTDKPRLTCKSLSNLLDPEHTMLPPSNSTIPLVENLSSGFLKNFNGIKYSSTGYKDNSNNAEGKSQFSCIATIVPPSYKSYSDMNVNTETSSELNKQKPKADENQHSNDDSPGLSCETNAPLWHPLFGRKFVN